MTFKKIFLLGLILWALLGLVKVWFFYNTLFDSVGLQGVVFWIITAIISVAAVRRLGVIHYIEALFVISIWVVGDLIFDLFITRSFAGLSMFATVSYWVSFFVAALAIFIFHKKRHVQIRKEHASHHAHGHGGHH